LIEAGVDILNPIQATANNLPVLKRISLECKLALWGWVNADILMRGTPKEVEEEVRLRISQLAPGGGYVLAPDQGLPFPSENLKTMINTALTMGKYPLSWRTNMSLSFKDRRLKIRSQRR